MKKLHALAALCLLFSTAALAQTHRPWFPTTQKAEKFSANIKFMSGKTFHEITLS